MSPIPDDAIEAITETYESGSKKKTSYFVGDQQVGWRYWAESVTMVMEYEMQNGKYHGHYRYWYENGIVEEEGDYIDGLQHGEVKQYDWDGKQIGSSIMNQGTGLDLWYELSGKLSEERQYVDGMRHGYEHWWRDDNQTVWEESHFSKDIQHGIFRRWNLKGKMARGYPQYYVMSKRVTKRQYMSACRNDTTLPPFVAEDNQPTRNLPAEVAKISKQVE